MWSVVRILWFCLWWTVAPAWAQTPPPVPAAAPASAVLTIDQRDVMTFRVPLLGYPPADRASIATERIRNMLSAGATRPVTMQRAGQNYYIEMDGRYLFTVQPGDANPLTAETQEQVAQHAVDTLNLIIRERNELAAPGQLALALLKAALIILITALLINFGIRIRRWCVHWIDNHWPREVSWLAGPLWLRSAYRFTHLVHALWVLALLYTSLSLLLSVFPLTRAWGEALNQYLLDLLFRFGDALVEALPGLGVVIAILVLTRITVRLLGYVLSRVEKGELELPFFDQDTAGTTRKLLTVLLWLFALAMIYPYLPGSNTEAFKGLSVVLGLMVSLGASGVVSQFASGLILIYSRSLKVGEYVSVAGEEGTVQAIGLFATRIHTNMREEISIPNSVLVSQSVKNYSRLAAGGGVISSVQLTIGYATPWRQVEAMLLEAAHRTRGVRQEPAPFVFQTALSDFYVEYSLRVSLDEPAQRARILDELNSHILDVFNEYGVQITSPHYEGDPAELQVVPPANWYAAPARPPQDRPG